MAYETLIIDTRDYVATITLNRSEQLNTFSTQLASELNAALLEVEKDDGVRVAVIRGAGKAFCAGIDVSEFFDKSLREYKQWVELMERMALIIASMGKPVIASAHGYAVANGAGIIGACDLAVVTETTRIGTTAINVGLFCMGPAVALSRQLGRKRCLEMLLTGDLIDAATAAQWGLVNRVVPDDKLEEATRSLAAQLVAKSPIALQMGKQTFYGMSDMEFAKALDYSNERFAALCVTEDAREGVEAFLEKRQPVWRGR
jgi:enoyl-CoA hydratase/carnithine racemase